MDGDLSAVPFAQRRSSLRRAVATTAEVTRSACTGAVTLTIENLSIEGMWLRAQQPVAVGDELAVSFRAPGSDAVLSARVRVVRVAASCGCALCAEVAGIGVSFIELSESQRAALEGSLRGLPPPLPRAAPRVAHADAPEEPGTPIIPACALMTSIFAHGQPVVGALST